MKQRCFILKRISRTQRIIDLNFRFQNNLIKLFKRDNFNKYDFVTSKDYICSGYKFNKEIFDIISLESLIVVSELSRISRNERFLNKLSKYSINIHILTKDIIVNTKTDNTKYRELIRETINESSAIYNRIKRTKFN